MTIGGIVLTEKNRLHHAMKEQDFIDNTKKPPSFIDKESVANAIKDYQKQKSIHSLSIKESPKVINHDINWYQDESNVDEDTTKRAYPENISSQKRGYIHYGHQYKKKNDEKDAQTSDCKEQHSDTDEKQEEKENAESSNEADSANDVKEIALNENIFTGDETLEIDGHIESGKQKQPLKENVIHEKTKIKQQNKAASKKRTHRISKKKKKQLLEKFKNKRTGDGSIDKENEANTMIDLAAKARDLKVMAPQMIGQVKDKTVLIATKTVSTTYQTAVDLKKSVSDAKVFANKVNGLIKHKQSYGVHQAKDCSDLDNFNEVLNLYLVYSIEAQAVQEDYLFIDTDEEEERLDKAFALFNSTYTTNEGKVLHVVKQTYEEVADSLSDTQKDYYMIALEASSIGAEEGYVIDKRIVKENGAKKALENSPQGTLPMSYEELKAIFTWMNADNVYPIDDGGVRYVTSQYTLARTDIDENHTTHYGVDFTSGKGIGANLVAIAEASVYKIVHVEEDGTGYGNHLILRFNDGTYALYAHMNDFITAYGTNAEYDEDGYMLRPATDEEYLHEGDYVQAGDLIGHMGNTGDSFGAHLHLVLSTDAYGTGEGSRYDFNDYVSCVWVKDFDYSYDY